MPLRVLTISKPYVAAAYRHKFQILARDPRLVVGLICPQTWGLQGYESDTSDAGYWQERLNIWWNGQNHLHLYRGLGAAIAQFRPDLLNVEEEHYSLVTAQAFLLAARRRIPAIFYTWQNIPKTYPPPFSWTERMVLAKAPLGVGGNQESLDILRRKGFGGVLRKIPQMGINLARFAPEDPSESARAAAKIQVGLDPQRFWVGFAGRLVEEKGLEVLIKATALCRTPIGLVLLGDGPLSERVKSLAIECGLGDRMRIVPAAPSQEVPRYLQAFDALCLPSLTRSNWKEQFGRVLTEGMGARALLLGSSSGEIPEVIGPAGLIHQEGDAEMLASQMALLAQSDPETRENFRVIGDHRVRELYTNDRVAAQWAEAFLAASSLHKGSESRSLRHP